MGQARLRRAAAGVTVCAVQAARGMLIALGALAATAAAARADQTSEPQRRAAERTLQRQAAQRALQQQEAMRLIDRPTAVMPAAYAIAGISHRGAPVAALEVRLGGIASVGVGYDDRLHVGASGKDAATQGRVHQWFRLGVEGRRWFAQQPALELTFERTSGEAAEARAAELRLAASRRFRPGGSGSFDVTLGVGLWDVGKSGAELSSGPLGERVRPYGGVAWTPPSYPRTSLLLEGSFGPSVIDGQPRLDWRLGWGARYQVFSWSTIDLVVRNRQDAGLAGSTVMVRLAARMD